MSEGNQGIQMNNFLPSHRRRFLQLATAGASTLWLPRSAWSQTRFASNPFLLGVASGAPDHSSVVLWTRLALTGLFGAGIGKAPVTVRWEVAHDDKFTRMVHSGQALALAELAHSVHVEVTGLESDRWYFYRFMVGDASSPTGRTRTLATPDAAPDRLRLAFASCQRWEHGYFSAYRHMLQDNPDLVLFLGDYIYEYPNASNAVRVPKGGWVLTLDDYRQRYALYRGDPDLQAAHAACPWLVTWDDHEVQNDYTGQHPGDSGPPVANFAERRAAAYQAFYEHMPVRSSVLMQGVARLSGGAEMRIYGQVRHGTLANLTLLDARQYKDRQACSRGGLPGSNSLDPATCPSWDDPQRSMLGQQQERWLDTGFAAARAGALWNVIGQQSLLGQRDYRPGPQRFFWNDGWDGYGAARTRLTDALRKHTLSNPVFLGGDIHENWVGHVKVDYTDPRSAALGVEFCGTSITSRSNSGDKTAERLAENPHFVFADSLRKGYGVCEFTHKQLSTTLRVVDDVTRKDSKIETLATFVVPAGRPVLERA